MEEQQSYYMVIPAPVWSAEITAKAMILYGHVSVLAKKEGFCYANNRFFERVMKCSTSTINRCFIELEENNLISREVILKDNSKEVETRKIWIYEQIPQKTKAKKAKSKVKSDNRPIAKNDYSPIIKNDNRPIVKNDIDNSTRINNTRSNISLDEDWTFLNENWFTTESFTDYLKPYWLKIPQSEQNNIIQLIKLNPGFFKQTTFWKRNFFIDAQGSYDWLFTKVQQAAKPKQTLHGDMMIGDLDELYKDLK